MLSYKYKVKHFENNNNSKDDLLFVSELAYFEQGKAIKGGIPICWPWFGRDSENPDRQMHGFARNMLWQMDKTTALSNGETQVVLSLIDNDETIALWSHKFKLILDIKVGKTLSLSLRTENTGQSKFKITQALHAYFSVDDIEKTQVKGLNDVYYLDKVTDAKEPKLQVGAISVNQEVDRIYMDSPSELTLSQGKSKSEVTIKSTGSKTTVVWNPWIDICKQSADLSDEAYRQFICVETANADGDYRVLNEGQSHILGVLIGRI